MQIHVFVSLCNYGFWSHERTHSSQPVFRRKPNQQILRSKEKNPNLVNNQCLVYSFNCDQCDSDYVGFTTRHLHQRIQKHRYSAIGKHLINIHGGIDTFSLSSQFSILKKCQTKFGWLLYEMFLNKECKVSLNSQEDSIQAEPFTWLRLWGKQHNFMLHSHYIFEFIFYFHCVIMT